MKLLSLLALAVMCLTFNTSCATKPDSASLISALTPATIVVVAKKPSLVAPLKEVVATVQKVTASGTVTPADLIANFTGVQRKYPELLVVIELVGAAYQVAYTPDANNLATLAAIASAIQKGLPPDPEPVIPAQ